MSMLFCNVCHKIPNCIFCNNLAMTSPFWCHPSRLCLFFWGGGLLKLRSFISIFSVSKIFDLAKVHVKFLQWHSYLTDATTAQLWWQLWNTSYAIANVWFHYSDKIGKLRNGENWLSDTHPLVDPYFNTLRPRQHGHHFPDDIFKRNFVNENVWILIQFSLNIVPDGPINNIPALVQIMAWRRLGDKSWSKPMTVVLLTHICVTRPQWVKEIKHNL